MRSQGQYIGPKSQHNGLYTKPLPMIAYSRKEAMALERDEHLQIRVTPDERDMIITMADELGMSMSDFVIGAVSKYVLRCLGLEAHAHNDGKTAAELLLDL